MRRILLALLLLVPALAWGQPATTTVPSSLLTQPLTLASPTISGTVTGTPAWASGQTFPTIAVPGAASLTGGGTLGGNWSGPLTFPASASGQIVFNSTRTWSGNEDASAGAEIYNYTNQTGSTTTGNPVAYNYLSVASDTLQAPSGGATNLFTSLTTGAGITGSRVDLWGIINITGTAADSSEYTAGIFQAQATAPANSSGSQLGGANATCGINAGATGQWYCVGEEIDVEAASGTTPKQLTGLSVVLATGAAEVGSLGYDTGIALGSQSGVTAQWTYGLRFGGPGFIFPVSGTLIGAVAGSSGNTVSDGIDLSALTYTNALLVTPNTWVDKNASGDTLLGVAGAASAGSNVNYLQLQANASGAPAIIAALGTDANIGITLALKGTTPSFEVLSDAGAATVFQAASISGSDGWATVLPGIAASRMTQITNNGAGNNLLLGGPIGGGALPASATSGFPAMAVTTAAPTGTPVNAANGAVFEYNTSTHSLNVYDPLVAGWYHVALTAGAN